MNTWTPLWSSTLDSTLWEEPPTVRLMFFTLLMMRDPDHVVRASLRVIAKRANLDVNSEVAYKLAEDAIKILESPDTKSREYQHFEGRRLKKVEGGWEIVNGQKYLEEMKGLSARLRKTLLQRKRRDEQREAASKNSGSTGLVAEPVPAIRAEHPVSEPPQPLPVAAPSQRMESTQVSSSVLGHERSQMALAARQRPEQPVQHFLPPVKELRVTAAGIEVVRESGDEGSHRAISASVAQGSGLVAGAVPVVPAALPQPPGGQSGLPEVDTEDYPI